MRPTCLASVIIGKGLLRANHITNKRGSSLLATARQGLSLLLMVLLMVLLMGEVSILWPVDAKPW
jgi:hypothetical protein